jgi:hypothetical protein
VYTVRALMVPFPGWSQEMSHGFITTPLERFPNNNYLQSSVHKSVHTIPKDWFSALTLVRSMWSVLKCDYVAVIISQPVFAGSPNHFKMILVFISSCCICIGCASFPFPLFLRLILIEISQVKVVDRHAVSVSVCDVFIENAAVTYSQLREVQGEHKRALLF